ncbi:NUDIX domain-containing protein [Actinomadura darangshiensis]|uniref:NUDIX domain-containing protein n=1 Tax=Actinomadura darangshiensis TaxID=705336 RepID=A0A4R5APQ8_9ACTN|nr:NUDIX hydrolase [Actinomadura darangshiensis]TDD73606.1 NUDIX domain-containing protein [Actinomadura darangshiensis]
MAEPTIRAAGALLWRDGPEFAVIHRPRYDDWSFPKGKIDPGEHVLRAAVREIEEETGIVPRLGRRLPTCTYPVGERTKRVEYWAARPVAESAFTPNDEVDELVWLPAGEAEARLSYAHDVDLLREFLRGPLHTAPLVILRHASAGEKHAWRDADELRPLDATGRAEAADLAGLLHCYGILRPVSSATARCLETVLPYARLIRASVRTDAAFTVGDTSPEQAVERLLGSAGAPMVVSTHGEIVSALVTGLCKAFGEKVPDDPSLRKGEFWTAHLTGRSMAALERHSPRTTQP